MRRRRGFLLIAVLLLLTILLVLCGSYLRSQANYYRAARKSAEQAAARQLALSGLEDVRLKMLKDWSFPPLSVSQTQLTYVESVQDDTGAAVGTYRVTLSTDHLDVPFELLYVQSEGLLGPADAPVASHVMTAQCDMRQLRRDASGLPNPRYFRWVQLRDGYLKS